MWIVDHVCLFIELCGLKPNIYNKSTKESAVGCPTRSAYAQHKRYDSSVWLMCHTFWRRIMPTRVEERDSHVAKRHKINRVVRHAETTYTIALDDTIAKGMTHGCMTHSGDSSRGWIITERNTFNFLLLQFRSDQWSSSIGRRTPFRNPSLPDKSRVLCHFCSLIFWVIILKPLKSYASQQDIKLLLNSLEFTNQEWPTKTRRLVDKSHWLAQKFYIVLGCVWLGSIWWGIGFLEISPKLIRNSCFG